jgi:hypothetical protein
MAALHHPTPSAMMMLWPWEASAAITPALSVLSVGMHVGWALVLGAISVWLLQTFSIKRRRVVAVAVILLCLIPNAWSPSWWLGLAFQTPSLILQGLCGLYLYRGLQAHSASSTALDDSAASQIKLRWPLGLLLPAIIAGWILALDTFALFGISFYPIGFTPYTVLAALFFACLLQLISTRSGHPASTRHYRELAVIILLAIVVHMLFRLPTGNMWDALIDPWLWMMAHGFAASTLIQSLRAHHKRGKVIDRN